MLRDALDPGADNAYPYFPRRADGSPLWSDSAETDGIRIDGVIPMPRGSRFIIRDGRRIAIDVTPRNTDGAPVNPPSL
ncbi:MAG: hypothetical protein AUG51_07770 [Acidobacteria bacterium 13_1_20CM_3_53_8]|nr:MAG: hypothetical protein AUG51_07770 [Acidobacteria bacterium 13_1_20CM_3_53_8]